MTVKKILRTLINRPPEENFFSVAKKIFPRHFGGQFYGLRKLPRFTKTEIILGNKRFRIADNGSFFFMYKEIFEKEIYRFKSRANKPYVVDCGANIGLSVIYFKKIFPDAEIVAFEPDRNIFEILKFNINSFKLDDVNLINQGLWNTEGTQTFSADGADGGRVILNLSGKKKDHAKIVKKVECVRLRPYLAKPVEFLKIDIEGAETRVLQDCADLLGNVRNLFVEYHSLWENKQELQLLLSVLSQAGFRYYIHQVGVMSPHPFVEGEIYNGMDMQLNIYARRF